MSDLQPGDLCVILSVYLPIYDYLIGRECTVIERRMGPIHPIYIVEIPDCPPPIHDEWRAARHALLKINPDPNQFETPRRIEVEA